MKISIVHKLILSSIFLVLSSAGVVGGIFYTKTTDILVNNALIRITQDIKEAGSRLLQVVNSHDEDVLFLASTPPFQGIIRARSGAGIDQKDTTSYTQWTARLETIFESLLERKNNYHMIRFIDHSGKELVSVYREEDHRIVHVKEQQLQNKAHRSYVKDTLKLANGDIYISEINLNREFGEVVLPYKEVFRISTPIYDERSNKLAGMVIVTFEIGSELRDIQRRISKRGDGVIYITNDSGGYLLHPEEEKTYGFDLEKRFRIQEDIPQLSEQFLPDSSSKYVTLMQQRAEGKSVVNFTKIYFDSSRPERFIAVIMTQDHSAIVAAATELLSEIVPWAILLAFGGMSLAIVFSVRITKPIQQMTYAVNEFSQNRSTKLSLPVALSDEVGVLARSFNTMVKEVERSHVQLEDMNTYLELMVDARTNDLNKALVEAERANIAKSEFLSQMSHELRTPMNAILGFGQMLELDEKNLDQMQKENIEEILTAGRHLLDLINDILDLSRIESGSLDVTMGDVSVNEVVADSIALIQAHAASRQLEIINLIADTQCIIQADTTRLKQILLNLLSNAVKYNRDNGRITLTSEVVDNNRLRISVVDSGEGLSEKSIKKLFVPFERLNKKHNVEGVGIGLVISKQLVELMEGSIGVECIEGEGCTFWIELELSSSVSQLYIEGESNGGR